MEKPSSIEIAELICTRLSHDLIGNIGALCNAVELMEDEPSDIDDLKPLLKSSSETLSARLKFFRLAFGLKNAMPKTLDEMILIADKYVQTIGSPKNPILIHWKIHNISLYKMIFLSLMALCDSFIRGGNIDILETDDGLAIKAFSDFDLASTKLESMQKALNFNITEDNPALYAPLK